jgi:predicted CXXCH cytochrome family protein
MLSVRAALIHVVITALLGWPGDLHAFHEGGVAACNGCHTMHNMEDGQPIDPDHPTGNAGLLRRGTPSDVCLSCHADQLGAVFGQDPLAPPPEKGGGNFAFLLEDNLNDAPGGSGSPIPGDAAGHNLAAPSRGSAPDVTHTTSPGGSFPANQMGCTSCHDPHGNANFRMLYDAGPLLGGSYIFTQPAPDAIGLDIFSGVETNASHTAYRSGLSPWCQNCHADIHRGGGGGGTPGFTHRVDHNLGGNTSATYNQYNGTEDPTGGDAALAYLAAVPFEDMTTTTTSTAGPQTQSTIMCLSCHRAHASSAPDAGRWDFNITFLAEDGIESGSFPLPNPYSPNQKSLCEKCHGPE